MNIVLKEFIRRCFIMNPIYQIEKKHFNEDIDGATLQNIITKAIKNVPYYYQYNNLVNEKFSLNDFPIIRKRDIMGHESEMVSKKTIRSLLQKAETGGSTGMSLELYYSPTFIIKKQVATDYAFSLIGEDLNVALLRGQRPAEGKIFQKVNNKQILLSSYLLSEDNIDEYIKLLKEYHINCLHVYPSSLSIFIRLIKAKYGTIELPDLKGILSSSEIFSREEKELTKEVLPNVNIVDYYSQNESACCAISVDSGFYRFFSRFGFVEFVDTGERINGNRIAEIVATSVMNTTMPFIRYATDDYVELDDNNNVVSIIGRTSDFVVNKAEQLSPCIVVTRTCSMVNVTNFQFYQPEAGCLIFRVVVNKNFTDKDKNYLIEDMDSSFNGKMDCDVDVVDSIPRTKAGKQKRLIQDIEISKYK